MTTAKNLKVALIHDYLREYGGAERVLEELHQIFPDAPVYIAFSDEKAMGDNWQRFASWDIRETWLSKLPLIKKTFSPLRIFAAKAFRSLDLSEFDILISSSNAYMAKAVETKKEGARHICYCHTPPRVLYGYSAKSNWKANPITRIGGELINFYMRQIDFKTAQKVDQFIANSKETQARIKKFYRRDSVVINPPVKICDLAADYLKENKKFKKDNYFLYVNRLALAKHPELAVQAATDLDLPLKIVGTGSMLPQLKKMAGPTVEFLEAVNDRELAELYLGAKALLYPVEDEDFGMVPIEAMAWGTPVIAHYSGGPKETISEGETGTFFKELNLEGLKEAIKVFKEIDFNANEIHQAAMQYGRGVFEKKIRDLVAG